MGIGGISIWQLLIILAIVVMLFGTKRLRTLGSDLGSAIKGFKKSMSDDDNNEKPVARQSAEDEALADEAPSGGDKESSAGTKPSASEAQAADRDK